MFVSNNKRVSRHCRRTTSDMLSWAVESRYDIVILIRIPLTLMRSCISWYAVDMSSLYSDKHDIERRLLLSCDLNSSPPWVTVVHCVSKKRANFGKLQFGQAWTNFDNFHRAMHMHKRGICRHAVSVRLSVCLSVCPSVTFVSCAKTNKDIFKIFSLSGSHTILVFPHQTGWW